MSTANDRARAIALLKEARDLLADRLTERILESGEELLEDAMGRVYSSEIENVYEQIGLRLNHINAMLSCLPAREESTPPAPMTPQVLPPALELTLGGEPNVFQTDTAPGHAEHHEPIRGALAVTALTAPVSFEQFALQVTSEDLVSAGRSLAVLFAIDEERGRRCAATFQQRLLHSPDTVAKVLRLRHEVRSGSINEALMLLSECFGLQGLESVLVLQTLQARLGD
jgi:hypothetical protein